VKGLVKGTRSMECRASSPGWACPTPVPRRFYLDFRKHRYYRHYSFDHYMRFDVDVTENHKFPPAAPTLGLVPSTEKDA
jgi:hypothetical protein